MLLHVVVVSPPFLPSFLLTSKEKTKNSGKNEQKQSPTAHRRRSSASGRRWPPCAPVLRPRGCSRRGRSSLRTGQREFFRVFLFSLSFSLSISRLTLFCSLYPPPKKNTGTEARASPSRRSGAPPRPTSAARRTSALWPAAAASSPRALPGSRCCRAGPCFRCCSSCSRCWRPRGTPGGRSAARGGRWRPTGGPRRSTAEEAEAEAAEAPALLPLLRRKAARAPRRRRRLRRCASEAAAAEELLLRGRRRPEKKR